MQVSKRIGRAGEVKREKIVANFQFSFELNAHTLNRVEHISLIQSFFF